MALVERLAAMANVEVIHLALHAARVEASATADVAAASDHVERASRRAVSRSGGKVDFDGPRCERPEPVLAVDDIGPNRC